MLLNRALRGPLSMLWCSQAMRGPRASPREGAQRVMKRSPSGYLRIRRPFFCVQLRAETGASRTSLSDYPGIQKAITSRIRAQNPENHNIAEPSSAFESAGTEGSRGVVRFLKQTSVDAISGLCKCITSDFFTAMTDAVVDGDRRTVGSTERPSSEMKAQHPNCRSTFIPSPSNLQVRPGDTRSRFN
ncbi:hypothetical protein FB451DRAFT_1365409 [Mycena latifolia]|nr:hypothetical protein FB451DRAFT_1365409 [Mycena latifolia]